MSTCNLLVQVYGCFLQCAKYDPYKSRKKETFTYFIRTQYITCMQSDRFRDEKTSFNVPNTVINTKLRPHKSVKFKQSTKISPFEFH